MIVWYIIGGAGLPGGARRHLRGGAGALLAVQYFGNRQNAVDAAGESIAGESGGEGQRGIKRAASLGEDAAVCPTWK